MSEVKNTHIKQQTIDDLFLTGPGEDLVPKLLLQMSRVPAFVKLFGPYKIDTDNNKNTDQQRWSDYQRMDWSLRQLPAISIFESQSEQKSSDNAWLTGNIMMNVYWPANFRRSDLARVPAAFKSVVENFFASKYATDMLDELYYIQRDMKVYGLNEFGKELTWTTNTEGIVEQQMVPVTMVDIRYRIDLRSWYRALEFMGRTKDNPFEITLLDLTQISADINGISDNETLEVDLTVETNMDVINP